MCHHNMLPCLRAELNSNILYTDNYNFASKIKGGYIYEQRNTLQNIS